MLSRIRRVQDGRAPAASQGKAASRIADMDPSRPSPRIPLELVSLVADEHGAVIEACTAGYSSWHVDSADDSKRSLRNLTSVNKAIRTATLGALFRCMVLFEEIDKLAGLVGAWTVSLSLKVATSVRSLVVKLPGGQDTVAASVCDAFGAIFIKTLPALQHLRIEEQPVLVPSEQPKAGRTPTRWNGIADAALQCATLRSFAFVGLNRTREFEESILSLDHLAPLMSRLTEVRLWDVQISATLSSAVLRSPTIQHLTLCHCYGTGLTLPDAPPSEILPNLNAFGYADSRKGSLPANQRGGQDLLAFAVNERATQLKLLSLTTRDGAPTQRMPKLRVLRLSLDGFYTWLFGEEFGTAEVEELDINVEHAADFMLLLVMLGQGAFPALRRVTLHSRGRLTSEEKREGYDIIFGRLDIHWRDEATQYPGPYFRWM